MAVMPALAQGGDMCFLWPRRGGQPSCFFLARIKRSPGYLPLGGARLRGLGSGESLEDIGGDR